MFIVYDITKTNNHVLFEVVISSVYSYPFPLIFLEKKTQNR